MSHREILALKVCDMAMGSGAFLVQTCRYLADRLVEAWELAEQANPGKILATPEGDFSEADPRERLIPQDAEERIVIARRFVADRCLYGVDINPWAVEMAKLSIWLITMQRDRPFNFLDHSFKCGDSLLGVSDFNQIENFSLREGAQQTTFATANLFRYVEDAIEKRQKLESMPSNDHAQIELKNHLHDEAEAATAKIKALANCLLAFELCGLDGKAYEDQRASAAECAEKAMRKSLVEFQAYAEEQMRGRRSFHWSVEFPEVFSRGGFDAFVGNPPFMGNKKITGEFGVAFRDFLVSFLANGRKGLADLCAYFFTRANKLLKTNGTFGLLATNTIAQGDTRDVGLGQITETGSKIFRAIQSQMWPGTASVVISAIWVFKGEWEGAYTLDGRPASTISSLLTETSHEHSKPYVLAGSLERAFIGSYVLGLGFILTPEKARELIKTDASNQHVIFPYLGGADINSDPFCKAPRYVIKFFDWPLDRASAPKEYKGQVAADYAECLNIVEELVKPERDKKKRAAYRERWWQFAELQSCAYDATKDCEHLLVKARVTPIHAFVFIPNGQVVNEKTVIFRGGFNEFTLLQSSIHEVWAVEYSPTMGISTLSYSPSACVATFPFVNLGDQTAELGKVYHEHRREIMHGRQEGLTKTYNRVHNRSDKSRDITNLRTLHVEMDQAVADAYGWSDLDLGHGFHATKQGERYTLSEPARREVLDRLLALNHQRYEEEAKAGLHDKKKVKAKRAKKKASKTATQQVELF